MAALEEEMLVARNELRRNLRSKKGIAMFVLFVLGGIVPSLAQILLDHARESAHIEKIPEEAQHQILQQSLLAFYHGDHKIADYLSNCPPVLLILFQGTLTFVPLLALFVGFDQIAGDVQHRSIRYIVGRAQRHAIVIGKAIGVWGVIATMVLVLHSVVWAMMLVQGSYGVGPVLSWGLRLWVFSVAYGGAYVGLINLVSSWFKAPVLALFIGAGVAFGLWLTRLIILVIGDSAEFATWIYPATYETFMVSPDPLRAVGGCALAIFWGAAMVGLATVIVKRRDL